MHSDATGASNEAQRVILKMLVIFCIAGEALANSDHRMEAVDPCSCYQLWVHTVFAASAVRECHCSEFQPSPVHFCSP